MARFPVSRDERLEDVEEMVEKAIDTVFAEKPELFVSRPVYRGVDELSTELDDTQMVLLITAEVTDANMYDARRAILRAVKLALEEAE